MSHANAVRFGWLGNPALGWRTELDAMVKRAKELEEEKDGSDLRTEEEEAAAVIEESKAAGSTPSHVASYLAQRSELATAIEADEDGILDGAVDILADALQSVGMSESEFKSEADEPDS